jgi:hypothetical protein
MANQPTAQFDLVLLMILRCVVAEKHEAKSEVRFSPTNILRSTGDIPPQPRDAPNTPPAQWKKTA